MFPAIIFAASALAIPFESSPAPERPVAAAPTATLETSFEFAEHEGGYQLNALVFDLAAGTRAPTPIAACSSSRVRFPAPRTAGCSSATP